SCRSNWCRIHFGSEKKGCGIGTELIPKRGEEIHELKDFYWGSWRLECIEKSSRNDEENKVGEKPNRLHTAATIKFVVDENRCHVVSDQTASNVEKIPKPRGRNS